MPRSLQRLVFEVLMGGILTRAPTEKGREEKVISKKSGGARGVGTLGWPPQVAPRDDSTYFLWPRRFTRKRALKGP